MLRVTEASIAVMLWFTDRQLIQRQQEILWLNLHFSPLVQVVSDSPRNQKILGLIPVHELDYLAKYSWAKCEPICLTMAAQQKMSYAAEQWSELLQQIYKGSCCNAPVKVQTSTWLKCCSRTLRELCIHQSLSVPMNCSTAVPSQWWERLRTL